MKTRIEITISAICTDPEVEKRIVNALDEEDIGTVLNLLDYCDDETCNVIMKQHKPIDLQ